MPGSRPVWGAWIEIEHDSDLERRKYMSRPVWGAWIEISYPRGTVNARGSRAPYGARGLKYCGVYRDAGKCQVAPRMGRVD